MTENTKTEEVPPLYIWLDGDPLGTPPDASIADTPGVSDLELIAFAIAEGRLGRYLPLKIAYSSHQQPYPNGYRSVDIVRMLREYGIPHRRRFEILPRDKPVKGDIESE